MSRLARVSITHAHLGTDREGNNDTPQVFLCLNAKKKLAGR
jgi:hypothetical protein